MKFNPKIHKRRSIRLRDFDYSSENCYFITICCQNKKSLFGHIIDNQMVLNEYGIIAQNEWLNTLNVRKGIELGEFIVMPNHIHGILTLTEEFHCKQERLINGGVCDTPLQSPSHTLGAVIRGYKSAVTSKLKEKLGSQIWQRNYYEHIIRNEKSYDIISDYIIHNPTTWQYDQLFVNN